MPKRNKNNDNAKNWRIYITQTGTYIAGDETERNGAVIVLNNPVFVVSRNDSTGFDLFPVPFVEPGQPLRLYAYGLLGEASMPISLHPWFSEHCKKREEQKKNQPRKK